MEKEKAMITISEGIYKGIKVWKAKFSAKKKKALSYDEFFELLLSRERRKETVKSWLYTLGIFTLITLILMPFVYGVPWMIPIIFIIGFITAFFSAYVLTPYSLREIKPFEDTSSYILESLEELSRWGGLKKSPKLMIAETPEINAMAYASISSSHVCVTRGLIDAYQSGKINEEELKAILGHEIGHIKNIDCFKWSLVLSWISIFNTIGNLCIIIGTGITQIGAMLEEISDETVIESRGIRREGGWFGLMVMLWGWFLVISGFITNIIAKIASIFAFHLSRRQEYAADEFSAELTSWEKMIASLRKIDTLNNELVAKELAALPYADRWQIQPRNLSWIDRLWDTHPPIEKREDRLRKLGRFL
jgi:Zn-dependent protease with chaperone function